MCFWLQINSSIIPSTYTNRHTRTEFFLVLWQTDEAGRVIDSPLQLNGLAGESCNYLDLTITVEDKKLRYKLFDKRKHIEVGGCFLSEKRNFPHIKSVLTEVSKYGVVTSQLYRFNRRTDSASNFIEVTVEFAKKMFKEGYQKKYVMQKILGYAKYWTPKLGPWRNVLIKILKELKE